MSDDELMRANQLMADPPAVDSALSQRLGLHVVARLAMRHGIRVQLRHSWYNGVTALVLLPARLLVYPATETGTIDWGAGQPTHPAWSAVPRGGAVAVMPPPWPGPASQPINTPAPAPPRPPTGARRAAVAALLTSSLQRPRPAAVVAV